MAGARLGHRFAAAITGCRARFAESREERDHRVSRRLRLAVGVVEQADVAGRQQIAQPGPPGAISRRDRDVAGKPCRSRCRQPQRAQARAVASDNGDGRRARRLRGVERVRARFTLTMAACNLARLPRLLAA